jgi:hypothetical protein
MRMPVVRRPIGVFVSVGILRATGNRTAAAWLLAAPEVREADPSKSSHGELLVWSLPETGDRFPARTIPLALARAQRDAASPASSHHVARRPLRTKLKSPFLVVREPPTLPAADHRSRFHWRFPFRLS